MLTSYPDEEAVLSAIVAGRRRLSPQADPGPRPGRRPRSGGPRRVAAGSGRDREGAGARPADRHRRPADELAQLTSQEQKILMLVAEGKTNKQIAADVFLSDKTVKNYVSSILSKLNLERRAQAAAFVAKRHLGGSRAAGLTVDRMRIVTPGRGRRRHPLRRPGLPALRGGDPVRASRRAGRARAPTGRRQDRPSPHRGPGATPRAGDGAHFRHRALFVGPNARDGGQRGSGRLRARLPVRRPEPVRRRRAAPRHVLVNATPPDAHGFCSLGISRGDARGGPRRPDGDRAAQPGHAADPRRQLHPRRRHRPGRRGRRPALRVHAVGGHRRDRAPDRRVRRGAGPRRRHDPDGHRRDPGGDRAGPPRQARPRRPHRDVHGHRRRPRRGRRDHRRPQGAQPRQDRRRVPDGHRAGCTTSSTTTRWSRCDPVDFTNDTSIIRTFAR